MRIRLPLFAVLPLVLAGLVACSSKTVVESDLGVRGAPDWVNEGSQALNDRDGRLFHGVGQAEAMGNTSLQLSTADNRARAEVARVLTSYLDVVGSDYMAATSSGGDAAAQQAVSQSIRNLTNINLSGARIIARWKDKKSGTVYSLAELDMKQVQQTLGLTQSMNEDLRRYIAEQGENVFDRMAGENRQ